MAKFDLIDALKAKGFEIDHKVLEGGWLQARLIKEYGVSERVNDWGVLNVDFWVDVRINFEPMHGEPRGVYVTYSNGKRKEHSYDKRAYNAIRDTVWYNGYEL